MTLLNMYDEKQLFDTSGRYGIFRILNLLLDRNAATVCLSFYAVHLRTVPVDDASRQQMRDCSIDLKKLSTRTERKPLGESLSSTTRLWRHLPRKLGALGEQGCSAVASMASQALSSFRPRRHKHLRRTSAHGTVT